MISSPRRLALALGLVTMLFTAVACAKSDPGSTVAEQLRRDVDAIHALGISGVQARAMGPDGAESVATAGTSDLMTGAPVDPDGYFRMASTSKTLIATVILQLASEGKLSLEDSVERWLPNVVRGNGNDGDAITVRQLLQHTSGIHDDLPGYTTAQEYVEQRYNTYTSEQLVARAMSHAPDFAPGQGWEYSNTGYILLTMIIEKATGRPAHEEIQSRILHALALDHTHWLGSTPTLPDPHTRAYQYFGPDSRVDVTDQIPIDPEALSWVTTTHDENIFFRALLSGHLLPPPQLSAMKQTTPVSTDLQQLWPGGKYGLGLAERPLPCGGTYWSHEGGDAGYITLNGTTPNGSHTATVSMSEALADTPDHILAQERTATTLITHALCPGTS
ncbi:serine hydrolase domain-containing protein [Nocardia sp. CDC153]|uniref:serine hydrolase domain-containing protein n=1 Tax=Nocardia sp. CDC153 TaxID=3112167 RepID=UPI002DBE72F0|nr:serine hydrolase domain-containing protein [Nocardia sp. CDC153]MEC3955911.1 serine hydrolase domain-containing protein [Nocardia sp. CDC153]